MYLSNLIEMDTKELNKVSKPELVKTISDCKWQWTQKDSKIKELEDNLIKQSQNEKAVKLMLIGYLGKEVERSDYSGNIDNLDKFSLLELVGEMLVKASRY